MASHHPAEVRKGEGQEGVVDVAAAMRTAAAGAVWATAGGNDRLFLGHGMSGFIQETGSAAESYRPRFFSGPGAQLQSRQAPAAQAPQKATRRERSSLRARCRVTLALFGVSFRARAADCTD